MGIFDLFRAAQDVESVRLELHFVHPAYVAARAVVEDARLHWWDRDDGTVDVSGDGSTALAPRVLEAAQSVIPAERERIAAECTAGRMDERTATVLSRRLDALAAEPVPQ
jgi:hypothetical protein